MKSIIKDESGVSFGLLVIAAFIILGGAIWIELMPGFNQLFSFYNLNFLANGQASVQNQQSMTFHRNIIFIVPIIMLIGALAWGYIRALEKRNEP